MLVGCSYGVAAFLVVLPLAAVLHPFMKALLTPAKNANPKDVEDFVAASDKL